MWPWTSPFILGQPVSCHVYMMSFSYLMASGPQISWYSTGRRCLTLRLCIILQMQIQWKLLVIRRLQDNENCSDCILEMKLYCSELHSVAQELQCCEEELIKKDLSVMHNYPYYMKVYLESSWWLFSSSKPHMEWGPHILWKQLWWFSEVQRWRGWTLPPTNSSPEMAGHMV